MIDPKEYGVEVVSCMGVAKPFVMEHHYSGSFPASRLSVGLFRRCGVQSSRLVGIATFSQPMNNAAIRRHAGFDSHLEGVELGRFVLLDEVAGNGETWFLKRALSHLRREKPDVQSVISYADPMARRTADGRIAKPGHVGSIYAVMSASYRGRATARTETVTPDGRVFSDRDLSKIRSQETGRRYSEDELIRRGASPRRTGEAPRDWLNRLYDERFFQRRRNPGNHAYCFEMTNRARSAARDLPRLSYPVIDRSIKKGDVTAPPLFSRQN